MNPPLVADAHNDLLMSVTARPVERWGAFFRDHWLPQLRAGGVRLQVLPVFVEEQFRPEGALRHTLRTVECAHRIAEENADAVALCRDGAEIEAALASDRIALVLALESAPGVDADVELLQTLHRLGVRVASLAHFGRTPLADGSAEDATGSRLPRAGVEAVALMQELGMVYDVSHLGAVGVGHVLELATRPIMATHSAVRSLVDVHRNLSDEHLRGIADGGGLVCVPAVGPFLTPDPAVTVDHLVDHLEYLIALIGVEHVGLGFDFVKEIYEDLTPPCCEDVLAGSGFGSLTWVEGLTDPTGIPTLVAGLARRGWSDDDARAVLGENLRRFLGAEIGRPA